MRGERGAGSTALRDLGFGLGEERLHPRASFAAAGARVHRVAIPQAHRAEVRCWRRVRLRPGPGLGVPQPPFDPSTPRRAPSILAPMRQLLPSRRVLGFAVAAALGVPLASGAISVGCGPNQTEIWFCLNPQTGLETDAPYDANHYANGVFDPCHCFDPCGPQKTCPISVDAGPPPPDAGCDEGDAGDGG
jgi:hypothetical protein